MNADTVASADGTEISWSRQGSGPPIVLVHCVATSRTTTPQPTLPAALAEHFTVFTYDRRGTGGSSNVLPYSVEREFEDLAAVIDLAGGAADVYGFSSGATLALLAALDGVPIRRLVLLEPPLSPEPDPDLSQRAVAQQHIDRSLAEARKWFDREVVGIPEEVLAQFPPPSDDDLRNTRTIVHELTFLPGTAPERFAAVSVPTLVLASDHTATKLLEWAGQLGDSIPDSIVAVLPGTWHGLDDRTLTSEITRFLIS